MTIQCNYANLLKSISCLDDHADGKRELLSERSKSLIVLRIHSKDPAISTSTNYRERAERVGLVWYR